MAQNTPPRRVARRRGGDVARRGRSRRRRFVTRGTATSPRSSSGSPPTRAGATSSARRSSTPLVRQSQDIDVYVISGESTERTVARPVRAPGPGPARPPGYAAGVAIVAGRRTRRLVLLRPPQLADVVMMLLLGVVVVSMRFGYGPSLVAAVLSVLTFDFFFVPPYLSFAVSDFSHIVTFGVMFLVAVVISSLTKRIRDQADAARSRELRTARLYHVEPRAEHRALTRSAPRDCHPACPRGLRRRRWRSSPGTSGNAGDRDAEDSAALTDKDRGVADWVWTHQKPAGAGTDTLPMARAPLLAASRVARARGRARPLRRERGAALGRSRRAAAPPHNRGARRLGHRADAARRRGATRERCGSRRSSCGTPSSARSRTTCGRRSAWSPAPPARSSRRTDPKDEAAPRAPPDGSRRGPAPQPAGGQPARHDPTRGGGAQGAKGRAAHRGGGRCRARTASTIACAGGRSGPTPEDLPLVPFDPVLIEQVLINLLENATKYTPAGSPIEIAVRAFDGEVRVEVNDRGPGVSRPTRRASSTSSIARERSKAGAWASVSQSRTGS